MLTSFQYSLDSSSWALFSFKVNRYFYPKKKAESDLGPLSTFGIEFFATVSIVTQVSTLDIGRDLGYASNKKLSKKLSKCLLLLFWKPSGTKNTIKANKSNFQLHECSVYLNLTIKMPWWLRTKSVSSWTVFDGDL